MRDLGAARVVAETLGGAAVNIAEPLPVYRLALDDIEGPDMLAKAKPVGWRYLLEEPGQVAYADLTDGSGGNQAFASLSRNRNAERLNEAAHLAEKVAANLPDVEARILDVPALHLSAVWLSGSVSAFIPYIDPETLGGDARVKVDESLVPRMTERAFTLRRQLQDTPTSPTQGRASAG